MGDDDDEDDTQLALENTLDESEFIAADISHMHSLEGNSKSRAIKILGKISETAIQILVDTGSSHNFIHPTVAEKLSLQLQSIKPFRVYVGNGASLICASCCPRTVIVMQGHSFVVDLHVLTIHGPDVVLGMNWLESLGRVTHDYVSLTMDFFREGQPIQLKGDVLPPRQISFHSLSAMLSSTTPTECYEIIPLSAHSSISSNEVVTPDFPPSILPLVMQVLERHRGVFRIMTGLPPSVLRPSDTSPT